MLLLLSLDSTCSLKFGVCTPLVQYIRSKSGDGVTPNSCEIFSPCTTFVYTCVHTDSMHLQSTMQVLVCVYESIRTVLRVTYVMYALVQISGVYSWWAYTSVQITPLQNFGAETGGGGGGGVYSGEGLFSEFYDTVILPLLLSWWYVQYSL